MNRGPVVGRPFKKGQSGNPGGRPRNHVQVLARQHTDAAIAALAEALKNPRERVPAATVLLERGWGKPVQPVEGDALGVSWVVRAPAPVDGTAEWFQRYAPRDAIEHEPGD